jgi:hypothetical protein
VGIIKRHTVQCLPRRGAKKSSKFSLVKDYYEARATLDAAHLDEWGTVPSYGDSTYKAAYSPLLCG